MVSINLWEENDVWEMLGILKRNKTTERWKMRDMVLEIKIQLLSASKKYYQAMIDRHRANIEVLLKNPVGIGDHQDIQKSIEEDLGKIADYHGKLEALEVYFTNA